MNGTTPPAIMVTLLLTGAAASAQDLTPATAERLTARAFGLRGLADNPVSLIRASNFLTRLGEEGAIECLMWTRGTPPGSPATRDWRDRFRAPGMWSSRHLRSHPEAAIAATVYVSRGDEAAPSFMPLGWVAVDRFLALSDNFPVLIVDGIPFFLWDLVFTEFDDPSPRGGGGLMLEPSIEESLAWAARVCEFRTTLLRPPDNPFPPVEAFAAAASARLLASSSFRRTTIAQLRAELYGQTIAMVHEVLDAHQRQLPSLDAPADLDRWEETWSTYKAAAAEQKLYWNEETESYMVR